MNSSDVNRVKPFLTWLIHNSILRSIDYVVQKCKNLNTRPHEPDLIAALTLIFTRGLYCALEAVFPKCEISVTGVYCHQKLFANIGCGKNPEIGDILFVYIFTDKSGQKKYNSLLFQAKIADKSNPTISPSDKHQLELYLKWPLFKYIRAGNLNKRTIDILPKATNDGAQYLLIDEHQLNGFCGIGGTFPIGCATAAKTLFVNNDLATELVDFLKFKSGRAFEDSPLTSNDDWTKMIWDILDATKNKASKRKNAGWNKFPRQVDGCYYFKSGINSIFQDLHNELSQFDVEIDEKNFFDEKNISPSVVLIECVEQNEDL